MKSSAIPESVCGGKTMTDETKPVGATPDGDTSGLILVHLSTTAARKAAKQKPSVVPTIVMSFVRTEKTRDRMTH